MVLVMKIVIPKTMAMVGWRELAHCFLYTEKRLSYVILDSDP